MSNLKEITSFNSWFDKNIFDDSVTIDRLLIELCQKIIKMGVSRDITLVAIKNGIQILLYDSSQKLNEQSLLYSESSLPILNGPGPHFITNENNETTIYCQVMHEDSPVFSMKAIDLNNKDEYLLPIVYAIADKINLAFRFKEERKFDFVQKKLIEEFFNCDLATSEAWKVIARSATLFLPSFAPFKIDPPPLCQILTYKTGDKYIVMRGGQPGEAVSSTYYERIAIPLKVDETICGIPIEKDIEFLLTDPSSEYPDRYQSYLYDKQIAKSELVFTIRSNSKIIAILNIEHPEKDVFTNYCIESVRRSTTTLSPFVKAVLEREEKQRRKEISLLYIMTEILRRMASLYRHKIGQLLLKSRLTINKISTNAKVSIQIKDDLDYLTEFINEFDDKSKAFLSDLPNYIKYQNIGVSYAINQAIKELDAQNLEQKDKIKILVSKLDKEIFVYASQMLKEHIYNLVNNSVIAIKQRISRLEQESGEINISIKRVKMTDTISNKKKSPARIFVKITDNGGGVDAKLYPHIGDFGFTTRREMGGTGYGLPAAREYIQSVNGGGFKTLNKEGEGFEISFFLQEFDPTFHSTIS